MVKMKNRAYIKDSIKMLKNNLGRFISIITIIMLGTAFFVGMNTISPAMRKTAEEYMHSKNIYDYYVLSSMGYEKEDKKKFKEIDSVTEVQLGYSLDALTSYDNKDIVVRLISQNNDISMNKNKLAEGRELKSNKECLISTRLQEMYGLKLGDKINVYRKDDVDINKNIRYTEFEIVGITRNPVFLSKFNDKTSLLTGELAGYLMVKEEVFKMEKYTSVYLKFDIDNEIDKFSEEYKKENEKFKDDIKKVNEEITKEKFNKLYAEYEEEILKAEKEVENVEEEVERYNNEIKINQKVLNEEMLKISKIVASTYSSSAIYENANSRFENMQKLYDYLSDLKVKKNEINSQYSELNQKVLKLKSELDDFERNIESNLYDIYSLDNEESKFVELSKENNNLFYKFNNKKMEYDNLSEKYNEYVKLKETAENYEKQAKAKIESIQNETYTTFDGLKDLIEAINNAHLTQSYEQIKMSRESIVNAKKNLEEKNIDKKIQEAKDQIEEEKNKLALFKYVIEETPLYENNGFKSLKNDLDKIAVMGRIFPVMFYVIAALVTITTITRMIEEDRRNIGTLKALGYSKKTIIARYVLYSLSAGIIGSFIGTLIGSLILIEILFVSYSSVYDLPELFTKTNTFFILLSTIISLVSTVIVTMFVTMKELSENTAELMRPKKQVAGKSILLEKVTFIWKRLDFLFKICFRNIFRYKKRLFMTLIGIAGCTALIYAGLGLQSAINHIKEAQFRDIRKMGAEIFLQGNINNSDIDEIIEYIEKQNYVDKATPIMQQTLTIQANDISKDIYYIVISNDDAPYFIGLQDRKTREKIDLNDDGIVITEKLANVLGVNKGDKINISDGEVNASVKVNDIAENYLYNFIFLTPKVYERIYRHEMEYNIVYVNTNLELNDAQSIELSNDISDHDKILGMTMENIVKKEFITSIGSLMSIVILFVGCASLLSFTVLINLNNINIEERKRELATIKLLGFYNKELESYVFRENIILTIFGTVIGIILGVGILGIIIEAAEVETIFLSKDINYINMIISSIMTICFTLITNFIMKGKIRKIDMIESLKSVE